jgi:hypothetical protein
MNGRHDSELLTAVLDQEPVDHRQLGRLLGDPDACALLADLALLRAAAGDAAERPSSRFYTAMDRHLRPSAPLRIGRGLAAAAALALAVIGGWSLHERVDRPLEQPEAPAPAPPEPARILHFERGVDWQE